MIAPPREGAELLIKVELWMMAVERLKAKEACPGEAGWVPKSLLKHRAPPHSPWMFELLSKVELVMKRDVPLVTKRAPPHLEGSVLRGSQPTVEHPDPAVFCEKLEREMVMDEAVKGLKEIDPPDFSAEFEEKAEA